MSKGKGGRRPYKAPDGVSTQSPSQTAAANAGPRPRGKKSVYSNMYMEQRRQYPGVKPGYGKTGRFA